MLPAGAGATIEGMRLNGADGENEIGPRIYADRVVLRDNEITNHHTGICIHIDRYYSNPAPRDVLIERNGSTSAGSSPRPTTTTASTSPRRATRSSATTGSTTTPTAASSSTRQPRAR